MKHYYLLGRFWLYSIPLLLCIPFQFKQRVQENPIFWIIWFGGALLSPIAYKAFTFKKVTHKLFLLYSVILTLLLPFSINIEISFYIALLNWNFFIFFLAASKLLQDDKSRKIFVSIFFASVTILSLISLYNTIFRNYINRGIEGVSYMWIYYGHNHIAFLLLLFIPVNLYFIWASKSYKKIILCILFIVACSCLFLSKARAAPLGLLMSLVLTFGFVKTNFKKIYTARFLIGIIVVIGSIFAVVSIQKGIYGTSDRIDYWQKGIQFFWERPLTGYGLGSFGKKYAEEKTGRLGTFYALNIFVQSAAETGLIGLVVLTTLLGVCIISAGIHIKNQTNLKTKLFLTAIWIGAMAMLINDQMDFDLQLPLSGVLFWTFMGILSNKKSKTEVK